MEPQTSFCKIGLGCLFLPQRRDSPERRKLLGSDPTMPGWGCGRGCVWLEPLPWLSPTEMPSGNPGQELWISYSSDAMFSLVYKMGFPNCGASSLRNKLQTHMAWSTLSLSWFLAGWGVWLLTPLPPHSSYGHPWRAVRQSAQRRTQALEKRDRKYSHISVYFDAEKETGEKAHRVLPCNHCLASRSDAAGRVYCRGFPHLPGFFSILGLFDGWSLLGFPSCHPLALPRQLQQHFPGKDNETREQSGWAFLWKLFRYAPRLKSYLEHTIISHSTHSSSYFKECCLMNI